MDRDELKDDQYNVLNKQRQRKITVLNKKMGYLVLYLATIVVIVIGEVIIFKFDPKASGWDLVRDTVGNLMGVLAAFVLFDIAHEWLSKDSYASEVSEQILDTLMYHREAIELYENNQKKVFVNSFISSIVDDVDVSDMISNYLKTYLLTEKDFKEMTWLSERDCTIRTSFSYRFILEVGRTEAFKELQASKENDPYFYMQEELTYRVKYLAPKGHKTEGNEVKIGLIYDNAALDRFLRGSFDEQESDILRNCIFRENLDIEEEDKEFFRSLKSDPERLMAIVKKMFRPYLAIDRCRGTVSNVEVGSNGGKDYGLIITFDIGHDVNAAEHNVDIILHVPKKWNSIVEVVLVEPTKDPKISLSYNEDLMDIEMYSFLNKGESSAYANTLEDENGVFSISLNNEWVFPISGVVFHVKKI